MCEVAETFCNALRVTKRESCFPRFPESIIVVRRRRDDARLTTLTQRLIDAQQRGETLPASMLEDTRSSYPGKLIHDMRRSAVRTFERAGV